MPTCCIWSCCLYVYANLSWLLMIIRNHFEDHVLRDYEIAIISYWLILLNLASLNVSICAVSSRDQHDYCSLFLLMYYRHYIATPKTKRQWFLFWRTHMTMTKMFFYFHRNFSSNKFSKSLLAAGLHSNGGDTGRIRYGPSQMVHVDFTTTFYLEPIGPR